MTSQIFRFKRGINYSSNGSGGHWDYYESEADLKVAILEAKLDVDAFTDSRDEDRKLLARFSKKIRAKRRGDDASYPRVSQIIAVERHTDQGWMPVYYEYHAPEIVLTSVEAGHDNGDANV